MAELMQTLDFEGSRVRTITDRDGEPWFIGADVCCVLGLGNPTQALARLDEDQKSSIRASLISDERRPGQGVQSFTIVNEAGLYRLVLGSRKPEARRFKRWVVHEARGESLDARTRTEVDGEPVSLVVLAEGLPAGDLHAATGSGYGSATCAEALPGQRWRAERCTSLDAAR